jgi:hypothetical protein
MLNSTAGTVAEIVGNILRRLILLRKRSQIAFLAVVFHVQPFLEEV